MWRYMDGLRHTMVGDIEHMFDDELLWSTEPIVSDVPADVVDERTRIKLEVHLPGIKPSDIEVDVTDQAVTVSGKREETRERETNEFYSKEIRRGVFSRTIPLPSKVDEKDVNARYENGVLHLTLAKRA